MLHRIVIENFFSIADVQELTFGVPRNAPNLSCFRGSRSDEEIRLPVVVGFLGANASGKSNVLRAITSLVWFVIDSFNWSSDQIYRFVQPYRHKNWWGKPSRIMIEFDSQLNDTAPSTIFRYELCIANNPTGLVNKTVSYEALSYAPKKRFHRLFERREQNFSFGREFDISSSHDPRKESIRPDASVISTLTKFNHPVSTHLSQLIGTLQTNLVGFHRIETHPNQYLSFYTQDEQCLNWLNRELRRLDVGLESMSIQMDDQGPRASFKHVGLDSALYFHEESSGTKRFIEIFPKLYIALQTGSVAVIDELDNDFHPLLLPELFRWFADPKRNPHRAQLFFTAHNPAILDELEKEQIFFTEKSSSQATCVYGARDMKGLRRTPSLMKKYLLGELGAIPDIG